MWFQCAFVSDLWMFNHSPCVPSLVDCLVYLLTPRDLHSLLVSPVYKYLCTLIPRQNIDQLFSAEIPVRLFIWDIGYDTFCFLIRRLLSPFWFICSSDFWFWLLIYSPTMIPACPPVLLILCFLVLDDGSFLTTLLPVVWIYASLITWLLNSAWINNHFCICPGLHLTEVTWGLLIQNTTRHLERVQFIHCSSMASIQTLTIADYYFYLFFSIGEECKSN